MSSTNSSIYVAQPGNGFQINIPVDTNAKTIKVYVGAWKARGKFEAAFSDGSTTPYVEYVDSPNGTSSKVFTINAKTVTGGQILTLKYTVDAAYDTNYGNVSIQAATVY